MNPIKQSVMAYKVFFIFLFFCVNIGFTVAQTVDLSSVDEFFKVTSILKEGKEISVEQWKDFDSSTSIKKFSENNDKFLINTIKTSINIVFGKNNSAEKDSIIGITQEEMNSSTKLLLKKLILTNYINVNNNYDSIKSFRDNYDFDALAENARQRLSSFLGNTLDPTFDFKPIYFLFIDADGGNSTDALYIDFNLIFKQTEAQRINFLAHELFHNYRENFENHDFNYKSDLNHCIDMIQNEGIADLIDKSEGYEKYFTDVGELPEMVSTWVTLYDQAQLDLEKFHNLIVKHSNSMISEKEMVDKIIEIVKYNGHPIGFFMANHIVKAGYENEMLEAFYNPYVFFDLYNKAAHTENLFLLSDEFMHYLNDLIQEYY